MIGRLKNLFAAHRSRLCVAPSPYQPPTCAAASSDFPGKSEDAAAQVGGWYGDGTTMIRMEWAEWDARGLRAWGDGRRYA